jgi:hypothetical protein
MNKKDIIEIDYDKMGFLLTMKNWFTNIENIEGPFVVWSSKSFGSKHAGDVYTTSIIQYIEGIIDKGWYSDIENKDILNWMRELYIVNHKRPHIHTPLITTI